MIFGIKIADIVCGIVVFVIVAAALIATIKKRKSGGCNCGCSDCKSRCNKEKRKN